jgi:hypothetical protein
MGPEAAQVAQPVRCDQNLDAAAAFAGSQVWPSALDSGETTYFGAPIV